MPLFLYFIYVKKKKMIWCIWGNLFTEVSQNEKKSSYFFHVIFGSLNQMIILLRRQQGSRCAGSVALGLAGFSELVDVKLVALEHLPGANLQMPRLPPPLLLPPAGGNSHQPFNHFCLKEK